MAMSTDYSSPVMVNGYSCRNCAEVDYARKHIDPEHPKAGPFGLNDREVAKMSPDPLPAREALAAELANPSAYPAKGATAGSSAIGTIVDIKA